MARLSYTASDFGLPLSLNICRGRVHVRPSVCHKSVFKQDG